MDDFEEIVRGAIDNLPADFRVKLQNIEIVVEETPPRDVMEKFGNKLILGLYQGVPLSKRTHYYAGVLPDKISIYKAPILRISRDREEAVENIKMTLLHEIGHYFGINDKRLRELGC